MHGHRTVVCRVVLGALYGIDTHRHRSVGRIVGAALMAGIGGESDATWPKKSTVDLHQNSGSRQASTTPPV